MQEASLGNVQQDPNSKNKKERKKRKKGRKKKVIKKESSFEFRNNFRKI
jgi:hypothetical protein